MLTNFYKVDMDGLLNAKLLPSVRLQCVMGVYMGSVRLSVVSPRVSAPLAALASHRAVIFGTRRAICST